MVGVAIAAWPYRYQQQLVWAVTEAVTREREEEEEDFKREEEGERAEMLNVSMRFLFEK